MATAPIMATPSQPKATEVELMPVRETLNKQFGIDDKRIGYNPQTGYVTIDNQNVLRPPVNREGTTYAGQDVFNSAAGQINTLNNAYNLQQQVLNPQQQVNPYDNQISQLLGQLSQPRQQVNPIDSQLNQLIQQLTQRAQNPTVIDRNAAYASPQYAAYQAQAQQQAQNATRQAQEALGAARMSRGTRLQDRAQSIQNDANQYLETQALPQIIAEMQAREDAQTGNLFNLMNALSQQQGVYDQRSNQEYNNLYNLLNALGQQQGLHDTRANTQFDRAANMLDFMTGRQDRAEDVDYRNQQFEYGKQQDQRNFDRSVFESDRSYDFAKANQEWENNFRSEQFSWQKAQQAWENAFKEKNFEQQMNEAAASRGLQWANLSQRQKEFVADQAFREKQFQLELDKFEQQSSQPKTPSLNAYKSSPEFAQDYQFVLSNPEQAKQSLQTNAADFINEYGFDGYMDLLKGLPKEAQDETMKLLESILSGG